MILVHARRSSTVYDFSAVKRWEYEISALVMEGKYMVPCMCNLHAI
jgi:hypothetical protein